MERRKIHIGQVVGLHGRFGELKVRPLTDFPDRFSEGRSLEIVWSDEHAQIVSIDGVRPHKNNLLVKLKGVVTRTEAQQFVDAIFRIDEEELMPLPEHSYYRFQIVGMEVLCLDNSCIGIVSEILETPAHDVYVVKGDREHLVPALKKIVRRVDVEQKKMWIDREMIQYFED